MDFQPTRLVDSMVWCHHVWHAMKGPKKGISEIQRPSCLHNQHWVGYILTMVRLINDSTQSFALVTIFANHNSLCFWLLQFEWLTSSCNTDPLEFSQVRNHEAWTSHPSLEGQKKQCFRIRLGWNTQFLALKTVSWFAHKPSQNHSAFGQNHCFSWQTKYILSLHYNLPRL